MCIDCSNVSASFTFVKNPTAKVDLIGKKLVNCIENLQIYFSVSMKIIRCDV